MCTNLSSPQGCKWSCEVANNFRRCNFTCKSGYAFVFPTRTHTVSCNHDGRWDQNITEIWSQLPVCSKIEPAKFVMEMQLELDFMSACQDLSPGARNQLLSIAASNLKEAACARVNCTSADVQANLRKCQTASEVHNHKAVGAKSRLKVIFVITVKLYHTTMIKHTAECEEAQSMLVKKRDLIMIIILVIQNMSFPNISYVPGSVGLSPPKLCPQPWQGLVCTSCVTCPPGSYRGQTTCKECPRGTYQDQANKTSCISCPLGKTTLKKGSFHISDCIHGGSTYSGVCNSSQPITSYMTAMPNVTLPHVCHPHNHGVLSELWRKASEPSDLQNLREDNTQAGGQFKSGWYRFSDTIGGKMPECCPPINRCGTLATGWLNGEHPSTVGEKVKRQVCFHFSKCCDEPHVTVKVVNCGNYFVYHLPDSQWYPGGYCGDA